MRVLLFVAFDINEFYMIYVIFYVEITVAFLLEISVDA